LAVVGPDAGYNYFSRDLWDGLDAKVKASYTPVGVCLLTGTDSIIVSLTDMPRDSKTALVSGLAPVNSIAKYATSEKALTDMDGLGNTARMVEEPCVPTAVKAIRDIEIVNVDGNLWYIPSLGQMKLIADSKSKLNDALKSFGGTHVKNARYWSSTQGEPQQGKAGFWLYGFKDDFNGLATGGTALYVRPVMEIQR